MNRRTTPGRHRAPLNLPRPVSGTATVAASGLLVAALGAATTVASAPMPSALGTISTDPLALPQGQQPVEDRTERLHPAPAATAAAPIDVPAKAVPAPAPEDLDHTHFGELGFTGVTPEPVAAPAVSEETDEVAETAAAPTGDASAASAREESTASRSESRPAAPAAPAEPAPAPPATGQGSEAAIAWAMNNLGLPYSWGSNSGGAYDCSGFTTAAFRAAGISIPHGSEAQYHATSRVSLSNIQRGDLLFYSTNGTASGIFHVAIYLGDGQVVHSLRDWSSWNGSKVSGINYASGLMAAGRV